MRRSKGYVLAEILTSMLLQAGFVIVLCSAFYLLVSFSSDSQQVLTARERGQRVIQYVDQRIRTAGLGMWKLESSEEVRGALKPLTNTNKPLDCTYNSNDIESKKLRLPVAITSLDKDNPTDVNLKSAHPYKIKDGTNVQYGNILTLVYAVRPEATSKAHLEIAPFVESADSATGVPIRMLLSSKDVTTDFTEFVFLERENSFNNGENPYSKSELISGKQENIKNWTTLAGTGIPLNTENVNYTTFITESSTNNKNKLWIVKLKKTSSKNAKVYAGDELLYLRGERMFTFGSDDDRNFYVQELSSEWESRQPFQDGILEIYFELDTAKNILDLYVLSSGGTDGKIHGRPKNWPNNARPKKESETKNLWNDNYNKDKAYTGYKYHVTYVSRASWKLENLSERFNWN